MSGRGEIKFPVMGGTSGGQEKFQAGMFPQDPLAGRLVGRRGNDQVLKRTGEEIGDGQVVSRQTVPVMAKGEAGWPALKGRKEKFRVVIATLGSVS